MTGAGGSASASSSADWDSATWQSYRLADLPDDAAPRGQGGGQGRGLPGAAEQRQFGDFPNRPPRVRALSAPALPSPDPRPAAAPSRGGRCAAFASESPELHDVHMQGAAAAAQADGLGMPFASPSLMSDTGSETSEPPKPYSGRALPIQSTRCPFAAALTSCGTRALSVCLRALSVIGLRSAGRAVEANVASGVRPRA